MPEEPDQENPDYRAGTSELALSSDSLAGSSLTLPKPAEHDKQPEKPAPPDGGWGWMVVIAAFAIHVFVAQSLSMFSMLYINLVENLDNETGDIGWVGSLYGFSSHVIALPASIVSDIYGYRVVAVIGAFVGCMGLFLGSFAPNVTVLCITYGVIGGSGIGSSFFVCIVIVQQYFDKRRGLAAALCLTGLSVGVMTGALAMQYLINEYAWRGALMIASGIFLHISIFAGLFRPVSQYQRKNKKTYPKDAGLTKESFCKKLKGKMADFSVLRDYRLQILLASAVFFMPSFAAIYSHTPNRAYFYGAGKQQASVLPSITGLATLISRICSAFVADLKFVNRMLMYGIGILALALSLCFYTLAKTFTTIAVFCAIFGALIGMSMSVQASAMADMVGMKTFPRAQSMFVLAAGCGGLFSTPVLGYIFDATQNYDIPFFLAAGLCLISGTLSTSVAVYSICRKKSNAEA